MSERTLVLVKPDGVARGLVGEVLSRIERKGFRLVALELRTLDRATAEAHYGEHADKPFFGELVDFITSGPLLAAVIEGREAIASWRTMMGATDPAKAAPGTIRGDLATVMSENVSHGSRLARVGRPRDRAVLPRPGLTPVPTRLGRDTSGRSPRRREPASRRPRGLRSSDADVDEAPPAAPLPWALSARSRSVAAAGSRPHDLHRKASPPHGQQHVVHRS